MKEGIIIEGITRQEFIDLLQSNQSGCAKQSDEPIEQPFSFLSQNVYTFEEAMVELKMSRGTLDKRIRDGLIEHFNDGTRKFTRNHLINYIKKYEK